MDEWKVTQSIEVEEWLAKLDPRERVRAARHVFMLVDSGPLLGEPHTRQLRGKLRELRFHLGRRDVRITYFFTPNRDVALLTAFEKHSRREPREIDRAEKAMARWVEEEQR